MRDPDELYYKSGKYKDFLDELGTEIEAEDIAEREGNYTDACDHGFKVWTCLLELIKMLKEKADSLYEKWLKDEPDWGWGWIAWSDCYWLWRYIGLEQDFEKAEQILRKGLSVKNVSNKKHIEKRLRLLFGM